MRPALIPTDLYLPLGVHKGDLGTFCETVYRDREELIRDILSGQIEPWQIEHGIAHLIPGSIDTLGTCEDVSAEIAQDIYERLIMAGETDYGCNRKLVDWCETYTGFFTNGRFWKSPAMEAAE